MRPKRQTLRVRLSRGRRPRFSTSRPNGRYGTTRSGSGTGLIGKTFNVFSKFAWRNEEQRDDRTQGGVIMAPTFDEIADAKYILLTHIHQGRHAPNRQRSGRPRMAIAYWS